MKVIEMVDSLSLKVVSNKGDLEREISGCYICDLLSWVISKAKKDEIWITVQTNINVAAVAALTDVSAVIFPENIEADKATVEKAASNGITLLSSPLSAFELAAYLAKIAL